MRYRSRSGRVALDLDDDGTFTLWTFDESEPYRGTFAVTLVHDRPVELHAFGECHPLQPA